MFNANHAFDTMVACLEGIAPAEWSPAAKMLVSDPAAAVLFFSQIGEEQTGILIDIATESRAAVSR